MRKQLNLSGENRQYHVMLVDMNAKGEVGMCDERGTGGYFGTLGRGQA